MVQAATAVSVHVVSLPWRQAWRGPALIARDKRLLAHLDGVRFAVNGRTCGGRGTRGINMSLTLRREVALVAWESPAAATAGQAALDEVWTARGAEVWSASLVPLRSKGTWHGATPFAISGVGADEAEHDHVAALTYGNVRARSMFDFYVRSFPKTSKRAIAPGSGMVAGIGFAGSVPVRHPCTLSFWRTNAEVSRFAYAATSPHGDVQRRANEEGWFVESMFARFAVIGHRGSWAGSDPLT